MEKINIAEVLKDCPVGMELDCTMFNKVTLIDVSNKENKLFPIKVEREDGYSELLTKYGQYIDADFAKCVIFPKGKTTWEGFVPPCQFKVGDWITNGDYTWKVISVDNLDYTLQNQLGEYVDDTIDYVNKAFHLWTINDAKDGDVLFHSDSASNGIFIFNKILQLGTIQKVICYCDYDSEDGFCLGENHTCCWTDSKILHPATKEQRDILFQKIKEAGYEWNPETKTLVKLVQPKFKVGDKVLWNYDTKIIRTISKVQLTKSRGYVYWIDCEGCSSGWWNENELTPIPNKFDITTLVPFESRVLMRSSNAREWTATLYSHYNNNKFYGCGMCCDQCIPYEQNKHLIGKTDNCDEFYKTW